MEYEIPEKGILKRKKGRSKCRDISLCAFCTKLKLARLCTEQPVDNVDKSGKKIQKWKIQHGLGFSRLRFFTVSTKTPVDNFFSTKTAFSTFCPLDGKKRRSVGGRFCSCSPFFGMRFSHLLRKYCEYVFFASFAPKKEAEGRGEAYAADHCREAEPGAQYRFGDRAANSEKGLS
jgi:hypothetical protein